jgi:hypothetical protein
MISHCVQVMVFVYFNAVLRIRPIFRTDPNLESVPRNYGPEPDLYLSDYNLNFKKI